jgi:hypothetical protein
MHRAPSVSLNESKSGFGWQVFLPANGVADGFIAVRRELAQAAGLKTEPIWQWNLNPRWPRCLATDQHRC